MLQLDYPNDREVLETCECESSVTFRCIPIIVLSAFSTEFRLYSVRSYNLKHILKALRALANSTKTSLRIDEEGLLSLQFLMPSPRGRTGGVEQFIEFRVSTADEFKRVSFYSDRCSVCLSKNLNEHVSRRLKVA